MKIPIIPVATVGIFILMLIMASMIFKPGLDNPKLVFIEGPLEKNKQLQLSDGEEYTYIYLVNNTQMNITYLIFEKENCTQIGILGSTNNSGVCLDKWGMDETGTNSTFENPSIFLFKPWMLALKEGWRWNSTTYLSYGENGVYLTEISYRVIRIEEYNGRKSFLVEIKLKDAAPEYEWIDFEKRILLGIKSNDYELRLTSFVSNDV